MKKLILIGLVAAGLVAFVGVDVVRGALGRARTEIRETLTSDVPLRTQLAEAQTQIDAYAESVIRGEVAAENLAEMIRDVEREVRGLDAGVERERLALVAMRRGLEVVPTSTATTNEEREALRRTRMFRAKAELLDRRRGDLDRLNQEYATTLASLEEARSEQARLSQEVHVLAAEIESLEARTAAAQTREAVGDAIISSSGYAEAQKRLKSVRSAIRERNKLLEYYEYERRPVRGSDASVTRPSDLPADPRAAIDDALAAHPAQAR